MGMTSSGGGIGMGGRRIDLRRRPLALLATLVVVAALMVGDDQPTSWGDALTRWDRDEIRHLALYIGSMAAVLMAASRFSIASGWGVATAAVAVAGMFGVAPVAVVAYLALIALVIGRAILASVFPDDGIARHGGLALAVGYALIAGLFQVSVHFAINTPAFVVLVTAPVLVLGRAWLPRIVAETVMLCRTPPPIDLITAACLAVPVCLAGILLIYASYPEVHSDALMVGLAIPHQVAVTGRWSFDAVNYVFSVMPKASVWLFTPHYLLAGEPGARLFNALMPILSASLVFTEAARHAGRRAGLLLAGVLLSAPLTFWSVFVLFDDAVLNLFVTAAMVAALHAWRRPRAGGYAVVALLLSAAIATKLTGVFAAIPIGLGLAVRMGARGSTRDIAKTVAAILIPVVAIALVPYAHAYLATGNPVFPFSNGVFMSPLFAPVNFSDPRWEGKFSADILYQMTLHTSRFMEGRDGGFGLQHLLLAPATAVGAFGRRWMSGRLTLAVAVVFCAIFLCISQYGRYLNPTFPLVALCAAMGYRRAVGERWGGVFLVFLAGIAVANLALTGAVNHFYRFRLPPLLTAQPTPPAARVPEQWFAKIINAREGRNSRVLYLNGRVYGYPLDGTPLYATWQSQKLYDQLGKVQTQADAVALLQSEGITDVISDSSPDGDLPGIRLLKREIGNLASFEAEQDGVQLYRVYPPLAVPDTDISLGGVSGGRYLGRGWRTPEPWGTWAMDRRADWTFRAVSRPREADIHLSGMALPCACNGHDPVEVRVKVNGTLVGNLTFARRQEPQAWAITIPQALVGRDDVVKLRLIFEPREHAPQFRVGFSRYRISYAVKDADTEKRPE